MVIIPSRTVEEEVMKLDQKKALITGGGSGIGKAICLAFAKEGADIAVNDIDLKAAEETVNEIAKIGREGLAVKADVSQSKEVNQMVENILVKWNKIDILVNNAGIVGAPSGTVPCTEITDELWHRMLDVHSTGTFYCTRAVLPSMLSQKKGKIINMSSICGVIGCDACPHYSAAKASIIGFTKALAKQVVDRGVIVNAIAPGFIDTPGTRSHPKEELKWMYEATLLKRWGKAEEIAALAVYLASSDADFVVGEVININGGAAI